MTEELESLKRLRTALEELLERYLSLANSGDCGFWNPEEETQVISARAALSQPETAECPGHEDGDYHSCTATDNGRTVCDRCGLLRPKPSHSETGEADG